MLTKEQKIVFLELLLARKSQVFGKFGPSVSYDSKRCAWEEVAEQLKITGAKFKDWKELRDLQFSNIQRATKQKLAKATKTGQGKQDAMTEIDNLVIQILGPESGKIKPLDVEDTPIVFQDGIVFDAASTHDHDVMHMHDILVPVVGHAMDAEGDSGEVTAMAKAKDVGNNKNAKQENLEELVTLRKRKLKLAPGLL